MNVSNRHRLRPRPNYDSDSPSSLKDGTGFLADTPGGSSSATSVSSDRRDAFVKKRYNSHSGLSYDSSRLNSAPDSLADDWDLEDGGLEQVNVVARVRPLSEAEIKRGDKDCVKIQHNSSSITLGSTEKSKTFTFNSVFNSRTSQREVLEKCGIKQMIEMAVDGYSCTTFAYGQTGSGKTYTITGPISQDSLMPPQDKYGLIQRSFIHLFDVLGQRSGPNITFTLSASYLEIYNEQVKDLLNPGRESLPVRWSKDKGFYVENLFVVDCETLDDLLGVLEEGMGQRQIATNNINEYSSRSHTIVSLQIDSEMPDPEEESLYITKHGRLSFVDLAGSEKVKELGNSGELLTETTNINKSLLTLGNCISSLSDNRKRSGHIPYRDSKLTKLLADSLGGSGVTLMIACITPSSYCLSESLSTLRYANRAKRIKNKPVVRMDPRERLILSLKREVKLLRNENLYLRQRLEFPKSVKPSVRRNDTEESLSISSFSEDLSSGDRTPIPGDFDRSKGTSDTSLKTEDKRNLKRRETNSSMLSAFTPKSAADSSLYEMLQEYMVENEKLRSENSDLHNVRQRAMTEHEHLSKENDKLLTKLDQLERVFAASPISMSRTVSGISSSPFSGQQHKRSLSQHSSGSTPSSQGQHAGQLPPVDSKRGVPNGYRDSKPHPYGSPGQHQQPSPPHQYRSQPAPVHQPPPMHTSFPGSLNAADGSGFDTGGHRSHKAQHSYPPTQRGSVRQNDPGSAPDTSLSFPPHKTYHSQSSLNSMHSLPEEASPRGLPNPRVDPQATRNSRDAPATGESSQGKLQHKVDIYIPSIPSTSKEANRDRIPKKDPDSPRWDSSHNVNVHAMQERTANNRPKNHPRKPPSKPQGTATSSQAPAVGYSNRSKKNAALLQGKDGSKPSPKMQRRDNAEPASTEQNLDTLPHTPAVTPPPVKYKPKGTSDLLAATSGDLSKPPPDPESLLEINEKLRQELLDLDGEIQYMKYVNKAKGNTTQAPKATKGKKR
ncbi:kinesin heavy chain-like [Acanthaster planci]|uniref:Kinesin heavy chain-like n=1 Tax=Acanthaster planci TaxID=133434 RepID=A0A8B7YR79_ACAPL|nr:kinesin heavy chain-like [Acanthaster planci]